MIMEYRKVIEFKHNQHKYILLLDRQNKKFFLEINPDGTYSYITIEMLFTLNSLFRNAPYILNVQKERKGSFLYLIPKVIKNGIVVTLTLACLTTFYLTDPHLNHQNFYDQPVSYVETTDIKDEISYEKQDNKITREIDTYLESDFLNYQFVYDMDYLYKVFDYECNYNDIVSLINSNSNIPDKYKSLLKEYLDMVVKRHNNIELRVFYENLKTLKISECTKDELTSITYNADSYGCYVPDENTIYVLKDFNYEKGSWPYQVIMHEFTHAFRTSYFFKEDGKEIRIQFQGPNAFYLTLDEALASIFTVDLFDYEEKDIAYQLQSNYYKIMLECMNNYTLTDYVNHSSSYFLLKLDEYNNHDNYAPLIAELIDAQYKEFNTSYMTADKTVYYPIYEYISDMFYKKYLNENMTYNEARFYADMLVSKVSYDVVKEYNLDTDYFYTYFDKYCERIGIKKTPIFNRYFN